MGRRHRSSSFGQSAPTNTSSLTSPTAQAGGQLSQRKDDIAACNTLFNQFLHAKDADGQAFLHKAIKAITNAKIDDVDEKLDGLFLMDALVNRAKELDRITASIPQGKKNATTHNARVKGSSKLAHGNQHLRRMMLSKDDESGYTPIHLAVLKRDLLPILLLLKHASTSSDDDLISDPNAQQMQHPLRLLDGNLGDDDVYCVMNELAKSLDNENLNPLQLLGATSAGELEKCRESLQWKSLKRNWKRRAISMHQQNIPDSVDSQEDDAENANPRRYRRRMISFGDERDHDALNYEIENAPDTNVLPGRRSRSDSFNNAPREYHDDDDDEHHDNNYEVDNNDLVPLGDEDFSILRDVGGDEEENVESVGGHNEIADEVSRQQRARSNSSVDVQLGTMEYGCEVFTFGKADSCALGVPQFATAGRRERRGEDNFFGGKGGTATAGDGGNSSSYKPKRVEAFGLGELRRNWTLSNQGEADVDSPAVAVAAATHHTLVLNQNGRLFTFGLGKGGRLGTGDENHRPLPTRIMGPLTRRIVASIAAAENHSLCSTADGAVFAWGSNRFGQLGMSSNQDQNSSRLSPRRVEDLKHSFVVAVAAGERHSVALTKLGEVYAWGDNSKAQLGRSVLSTKSVSLNNRDASSSSGGSSASHRPQRVEGLWGATPRRRAIAISAAEFSTLVLTLPPTLSDAECSLASLPVNVVFGWGHGNHIPMRVNFPSAESSSSTDFACMSQTNSSSYTRSSCINPIAIACAKYHNVACTADGRVYTWGFHSESLGIDKHDTNKNDDSEWATSTKGGNPLQCNSIASPRLVSAMLPENGGGRAVAVSASESHCAVVTADGHLFTWGSCHGDDVLGHKGSRWVPKPRKVKRVHRAVGVASAKEHTVLLIGNSLPALPRIYPSSDEVMLRGTDIETQVGIKDPLSLQDAASIEIARNVDSFNVIPIMTLAYRLNCRPLVAFCDHFMKLNLDGVLAVTSLGDLHMLLHSRGGFEEAIYRGICPDGQFHPLLFQLANSKNWIDDSRGLLKCYSGFAKTSNSKLSRRAEPSAAAENKTKEQKLVAIEKEKDGARLSEEIAKNSMDDTATPKQPADAQEVAEIQAIPKKLFQGQDGEKSTSNSSKYHCSVCGVSCPDHDSYTLHMNGRKHRNRLEHVKAQEEKSVAESMMAMKRLQLMDIDGSDVFFQNQMMKGKVAPNQKLSTPVFPEHQPMKPASNESFKTAKSAWSSPQPTTRTPVNKLRSNSFQEIMNQEKQKSSSGNVYPKISTPIGIHAAGKIPASRSKNVISTPSAPTYMSKTPPPTLKKSVPLGAFLEKKSGPKEEKIIGGWAAKPANKSAPAHELQSKAISFFDIQKEEESLRSKEDHQSRMSGNKWYVHQRERAASIGEIQNQQQKDAEWLQLVEEQKQIEAQIERENQKKEKQESAKKQKKRPCRKKPPKDSGKGRGNAKPKPAPCAVKAGNS